MYVASDNKLLLLMSYQTKIRLLPLLQAEMQPTAVFVWQCQKEPKYAFQLYEQDADKSKPSTTSCWVQNYLLNNLF